MSVDFDAKYAHEADPWGIADAADPRYDLYRERLLALTATRGAVLDIGCGFGAFLASLRGEFAALTGVDVAREAVITGRSRFPFLELSEGSIAATSSLTAVGERRYDAIVFSDVIYYLHHRQRVNALDWIAEHLAPGGIALIAAYCPGGRYLERDELAALVGRRFVVLERHVLASGHVALFVRRRLALVALTVDYETWQPIPAGRRIDWTRDVLTPTAHLLDVCDRHDAKLTLFAEVGEYLWLVQHDQDTAAALAEQWREAILRGHDVQLHLHPNWLAELGARRNGDEWRWDWSVGRACDYPGDLTALIARCCRALEEAVRPVRPDYAVTAFRAGAYEAQPFDRLHAALTASAIACDSSVYAGGRRADRSYDYRLAHSRHQPYFAARTDPQLKAPPAERQIVELPILAPRPNERWTFDFGAAAGFVDELADVRAAAVARVQRPELRRALRALRTAAGLAYALLRRHRTLVNRLLPAALAEGVSAPYAAERSVDDDYFVLIGHTKADLDIAAIEAGLERLAGDVEFLTVEEMARRARADLTRRVSADARAEAARQVAREMPAVMSDEHNDAQSAHLQKLIPRDRRRVLDLGCGSGVWAHRIAARMPWAEVVGVDAGREFIARATSRYASDRVRFAVDDFAQLSGLADGSFDCVYADNSLEHAYDVDATLAAVHRVLAVGGVLVAAIPSDARHDRRMCDNHTWKTAPPDVFARLAHAGFTGIRITELDVFRRLGMAPYPPARNRMMFVRAWKRPEPADQLARMLEIARFVHDRLDPAEPTHSTDADEILAGGHAWCTGYSVATGRLLADEGFDVRWVTLVTDGPPPRGDAPMDAHELLEVRFRDGSRRTLDAMACVWYDASVLDLLREPSLAAGAHHEAGPALRAYDGYTSTQWFERVARLAVRADPRHVQRFVAVPAALLGMPVEEPAAMAALRLRGAQASLRTARLLRCLSRR